ncbi:helix-turn-helix transcriptional regulator [Cellulomonas sp. zg-ZUI22]|uniref:ArsR/SmtB family transcription factor n=1 Tax=Cellulomonas sp. zg-ZUI22 TaxID=2816955 RepID=UPI001A94D079|nr:metalloregulator ArsR/SmtB family transcription factor [Cellulomonas sp. zg-ZUI22]MBO0899371.1 helix-turn-helix transcriptional regulator [Cellulomonas sp. zg-ZUI22]
MTAVSASAAATQDAPLDDHPHADVAQILHALAEPTRLSLVHTLAGGTYRVVELTSTLGLAQSTVSAHLAVLRLAGLVTATPEGRATRYALADPEIDEVLAAAERFVARQREGQAPGAGSSTWRHLEAARRGLAAGGGDGRLAERAGG